MWIMDTAARTGAAEGMGIGRSTGDPKNKLAHHWIRNVPSYPLVFVAELYHYQERDGAGVATPKVRSRMVKKEARTEVNLITINHQSRSHNSALRCPALYCAITQMSTVVNGKQLSLENM